MTDWTKSKAWDDRYRICTVPEFNNPHIYSAYWVKCEEDDCSLVMKVREFNRACLSGQYSRWPGNKGGLISWDELIGLAYCDPVAAGNILVMTNKGFYDNEFPFKPRPASFIYRFPHLIAFLKLTKYGSVNAFWSSVLASFVMLAAISRDGGVGHHLRVWLIGKKIRKMLLPRLALRYWQKKRLDKGLTISECFRQYFAHIPEFAETAKEDDY